jgi:starvation-inducible DNA-binding protein
MKSVSQNRSSSKEKSQKMLVASRGQNIQNSGAVEMLNEVLANEFVLLMKTLNYHWNVQGPQFSEIHEFLEKQYREIVEYVDEVAERVRSVGGRPLGTMQEMLDVASLREAKSNHGSSSDMLRDLLQDHENLVAGLKRGIEQEEDNDVGSADLLTGLIRKHEKLAWMTRSYIQQ